MSWNPWILGINPSVAEPIVKGYAEAIGLKEFKIPEKEGEFLLGPGCTKFAISYGKVCLYGYTNEDKEIADRWIKKVEDNLGFSIICPLKYERKVPVPQQVNSGSITESNIKFKLSHPNRRR